VERTADDPHSHAGREPRGLRQLDKTIPFARSDFGDHGIWDACRYLTIHDQPPHARGPARIPPARHDQHEGVPREERRRAHDLATMAAALLPQAGQ